MFIRLPLQFLEGENDNKTAGGAAPVVPPVPAPGTPPPASEQPVEVGADGELPTGKKITLSKDAFDARISRASKAAVNSALKEIFGTDDRASIKKTQETNAQLAREAEERRQANMNELQRAQETARQATERASKAEARAQELSDEREYDQATTAITEVASKHIAGKYVKLVMTGFADHLSTDYTEEQLTSMDDKTREKLTVDWFTAYAKENPEVAFKAAPGTDPATTPPPGNTTPVRAPLQNGVGTPVGRGGNSRPGAKDYKLIEEGPFKGKHVSDLSKVEFAQYMKSRGITL